MILIVGLGNPGKKYIYTRHNIGFQIADALSQNSKWKKNKKANCLYIRKQIGNKELEIIKPLSFMNESGKSVRYIQKKHTIKIQDIIVVHDDIDLPLGKIKISKNRSSAGHKGVQSIINELGTQNFVRVRIGIAPSLSSHYKRGMTKETEKFVLEKFPQDEQKIMNNIIQTTVEEITFALENSIEQAMTKYN